MWYIAPLFQKKATSSLKDPARAVSYSALLECLMKVQICLDLMIREVVWFHSGVLICSRRSPAICCRHNELLPHFVVFMTNIPAIWSMAFWPLRPLVAASCWFESSHMQVLIARPPSQLTHLGLQLTDIQANMTHLGSCLKLSFWFIRRFCPFVHLYFSVILAANMNPYIKKSLFARATVWKYIIQIFWLCFWMLSSFFCTKQALQRPGYTETLPNLVPYKKYRW